MPLASCQIFTVVVSVATAMNAGGQKSKHTQDTKHTFQGEMNRDTFSTNNVNRVIA